MWIDSSSSQVKNLIYAVVAVVVSHAQGPLSPEKYQLSQNLGFEVLCVEFPSVSTRITRKV